MKPAHPPAGQRGGPQAAAVGDDAPPEPILLRPDGYHWLAPDGRQEFGPFATYEQAWADMHAADAGAPEPGESVQEAESEIGMSDWIDPETGEPAEGQSPPRLDAE